MTLFPKPKMGKIKLKNGSVIYVITDEEEYKHVEGKFYYDPPLVLDEANPHSPFYKINAIRILLKKAKVDIRKGRYKRALNNLNEILKVLKHLEISLKYRRKE